MLAPRHLAISTLALLVCLAASTVQAQTTYYVDATATGAGTGLTWDDAFTDLHAAFLAAVNGDTIRIAQGTYTPDIGGGFAPGNRNAFWRYRGGAVRGGYRGLLAPSIPQRDDRDTTLYPTILSGEINDPGNHADNSRRLIWTQTTAVIQFDGLTITGCHQEAAATNTAGIPHAGYGGAISILFATSYTLNDLKFINNYLLNDLNTYRGGPAMFLFSSNLQNSGTLTNSEFIDNTLESNSLSNHVGGAMYLFTVNLAVSDCLFEHNQNLTVTNVPSNWGGAIYLEAGYQTFERVTFTNNRADGWIFASGGAVMGWVNPNRVGNSTYNDCVFEGNYAQQGSCLWLWDSRPAGVAEIRKAQRTIFRNNAATLSNGSAIFLQPGTPLDVVGSLMVGNTIDTAGNPNNIGGSGIARVVNSTLTRDTAGASVRVNDLTLDNSIVRGTSFGNQHPVGGSQFSPVLIRNSNVSSLALMPTNFLTVVNSFDADPLFVAPPTDYRLGDGSPSIDAGDNALVPGSLTTDLDGNPRIAGAAVDQGAYERPSTACALPGDVNLDTTVNGLDVAPFVACVLTGSAPGGSCPCADINGQNGPGVDDVPGFVQLLLGS